MQPASRRPSSTMVDPRSLTERLRAAAELLEEIVADRASLVNVAEADRNRLLLAAGHVSRPDVVDRRRLLKASKRKRKADRVQREEDLLSSTGIRTLRRQPVFNTSPNIFPPPLEEDEIREEHIGESNDPRVCYVCKKRYSAIHHFYDLLCLECGEFNFAKRTELADLSGRVALLTGGRVKIGYQAGLKLLRAGARLIVTTRFPRDSAARYASEPDFEKWCDRLEIFGLDLRHTPSVEAFCAEILETRDRLD